MVLAAVPFRFRRQHAARGLTLVAADLIQCTLKRQQVAGEKVQELLPLGRCILRVKFVDFIDAILPETELDCEQDFGEDVGRRSLP